jgi:CDP-2,3-bis-(O-geranylgeranyl)-sn-glycerol synthase
MRELLFALWFFLPAGIANASPVIAALLPGLRHWSAPMDLHLTFRGRRLLGEHKTWRGLIAAMVMATFTLWLQQLLVRHTSWAATLTNQVDYAVLPTLLLGPLFGLGALGGDAIESFFKRQRDVAPGKGWFPFDQTDYIIGGAIATAPFVHLSLRQYAWLLLLWLGVHVIVTYIGYLFGLRERPI